MEFTLEALAKFFGPWAVAILLLVLAVRFLAKRLEAAEARSEKISEDKERLLKELLPIAKDNATALKELQEALRGIADFVKTTHKHDTRPRGKR